MRLQKFMAQCGVASRRNSEKLILDSKVKVNDKIIEELGFKINPMEDIVTVNNKEIHLEKKEITILLNKPVGYITTMSDNFGRKKVIDLIKSVNERIYPIGRLDCDTSGLLLLTNNGELTYKLTHPKHEITKTYVAKVEGIPSKNSLEAFRNGLKIQDYITAKAEIRILETYKNTSVLEIKIHEGRNRQVRRMCKKIGHNVIELKRVALGNINLGDMAIGKWRHLSLDEQEYLNKL